MTQALSMDVSSMVGACSEGHVRPQAFCQACIDRARGSTRTARATRAREAAQRAEVRAAERVRHLARKRAYAEKMSTAYRQEKCGHIEHIQFGCRYCAESARLYERIMESSSPLPKDA